MQSWIVVATLFGLLVPVGAPAAAGSGPTLHEQVIRMLESELSEEIVLEWLSGTGEPVPRPTAEELIALKEAGATDRLLMALLALATGGPDAPDERAARPAAASSPPESGAEAGVQVEFRLSHLPSRIDSEDEPWDLYVYLDGEPLAYVPPSGSLIDRNVALEFRHRLEPGRHLIRVSQERHLRRSRGRWRHEARISEQLFWFELSAGSRAELELGFSEGWLANRGGGPMTFRLLQDDRTLEMEAVGGDPERWPLLCEEIESNLRAGETPGRSVRSELDGCVRWTDLWPQIETPDRNLVREALAAFDYRPVPRGS